MSEEQSVTPADYEIEVIINNEEMNDIQSFVIYRCCITKTASFAVLKLNLKLQNYLLLEDDIRNSTFPIIPLDIYEVDSKNREKTKLGERTKHFCTKHYKVIQIQNNEPLRMDAAYLSCNLYLTNPILHYLNTNNSFNQILQATTALDAINSFESFLSSTYGDTAFEFKHIGESYQINKYIYEQILTRNENDLIIPLTLIQNCKPFNSYSFYFFDDFRLDQDSKADITCYLINIGNKDNFERRDITDDKYIDVVSQLKNISICNITDSFNELSQSNPSIVVEGRNINYASSKAVGNVEVPSVKVETFKETIISGRTINAIYSTISTQSKKPTEKTILYAPDNIDTAISRYKTVSTQLREEIHSINVYQAQKCGFDVFQFGIMYNVQFHNKSSFTFTPLSIINIFTRETGPAPILQHNTEVQFLNFKADSV